MRAYIFNVCIQKCTFEIILANKLQTTDVAHAAKQKCISLLCCWLYHSFNVSIVFPFAIYNQFYNVTKGEDFTFTTGVLSDQRN